MPQRYIDGFAFGETGGLVSGTWPLADLPRLQDMLRGNAGEVSYSVEGTRDSLGRPALEVAVSGSLALTCQRCLEGLEHRFDSRSLLLLARSESELEEDSDDAEAPDRILAAREMPVRELVEDEVLLLVPLAPRHERCGQRPDEAAAVRESPFAGLRGLLKDSKTN